VARSFNPGDQVQLNSGLVVMTVVGPSATTRGYLACTWIWDGKVKEASFPPEALRFYKPSDVQAESLRLPVAAV
jgi:uncharacterized protein YodC (DUF2158 family)